MVCAIIGLVFHIPFPDRLEDEEIKTLWSRAQWLLKNNFLHGIKWEGMQIPPSHNAEEVHD
jgi:hypothetical protein